MIPTLLPYQSRWVEDDSPLKVCQKGRRIGLSWAEAYDAAMHCSEGRGNVYYQSYAHDMTRGFVEDAAQWAADLQLLADEAQETILDLGEGERIPAHRLPFASGREIVAVTSAPRAFRSKGKPGDRAIVDEAAFVDDLDEVLKAALAFRNWGGEVHVISTHNGEGSAFNRLVEDVAEGRRPGSLHTIPLEDAVADGVYERVCEAVGEAWTPEGERAWVEDIRSGYPDDESAAEELDCVPASGGGAWLDWALLRGCEHPDAGDPARFDPALGPTYIGNDIARRRHLWIAWVIQLVGDVAWTREIVELRDASFAAQDDELDRLVARYRPIRVAMDQTGMGEKPVEDAVRRYGEHRVEGVLMTNSRRLDLATALKERYQDRRWRAPAVRAVRDDLHSIRKESGVTGAPRLVFDAAQKESHGDRFWAAALAAGAASSAPGRYAYDTAAPPVAADRSGGRKRMREAEGDVGARDPLSPFLGVARFGRGLN